MMSDTFEQHRNCLLEKFLSSEQQSPKKVKMEFSCIILGFATDPLGYKDSCSFSFELFKFDRQDS